MVNEQKINSNGFFAEGKSLSEMLNQAMDLRGLDVKKLSELTDIPVHYLEAMANDDFAKLPAMPYVRGYLTRVAEALRINTDLLLRTYKQEAAARSLKISGPEDKLPTNRFTFRGAHRKKSLIILGFVLLLIIVYLIWRADDFLGTPKIEINNPAADNLIISTSSIKLSGQVSARDKLTINGEEVLVDQSGRFEKDFSLQSGVNTVEFKATRLLGKETRVIRQIIYQP